MSRSGYTDDCEHLALWRGAVERSIHGKRGQLALTELVSALDAMTEKRLIDHSFSTECGLCTLGVLAKSRGVDMADLEPRSEYDEVDRDTVGSRLNISPSMAAEVMYLNDELGNWRAPNETPEARWLRMRRWAVSQLGPDNLSALQDRAGTP